MQQLTYVSLAIFKMVLHVRAEAVKPNTTQRMLPFPEQKVLQALGDREFMDKSSSIAVNHVSKRNEKLAI